MTFSLVVLSGSRENPLRSPAILPFCLDHILFRCPAQYIPVALIVGNQLFSLSFGKGGNSLVTYLLHRKSDPPRLCFRSIVAFARRSGPTKF